MSTLRAWLLVGLVLAFGLLGGKTPAFAATESAAPTQTTLDALRRAHAAVVGVQVQAAPGARSAATLGLRRAGSGVVIGADGLVLTIGYLMLEAESIEIITQDKRRLPAKAVAYDLATGFGLVQPLLPLRGVTPVPLGSAAQASVGDAMMAATGGEDGDVAMTQLVSRRPFSGYWEYHIETAVFTSPPIDNHSGAPLFNQRGELLGIGSLLVMDARGNNQRAPGNMFVPVDLLKPIMSELQATGMSKQSRRPWLGLTSSDQGGRVQVVRVNADSPAQSAGLQQGDLILAVDGATVSSLEAFYKKVWDRARPDSEVSLTVLQGAQLRQIRVKAVDRMDTLVKPGGI